MCHVARLEQQLVYSNIRVYNLLVEINGSLIEMDQMSDYDIRPKPKVWAGSPNECRTFGRMLFVTRKQRLLLVSALSGQKMSS